MKEVLFPLSLVSSGCNQVGSLFTSEELKKCWLVRAMILTPPILTLIVMVQIVGQKMAALRVIFL